MDKTAAFQEVGPLKREDTGKHLGGVVRGGNGRGGGPAGRYNDVKLVNLRGWNGRGENVIGGGPAGRY
jgi:hypothetical protein